MKGYENFEHGADVGIRGYGKSLDEAFSEALKALSLLYIERVDLDFESLSIEKEIAISLSADSLDELFVYFINQAISVISLDKVLVVGFKGEIKERDGAYDLKGVFLATPFREELYGLGVEVKGATFTMAKVEKKNGEFVAQCVVDV